MNLKYGCHFQYNYDYTQNKMLILNLLLLILLSYIVFTSSFMLDELHDLNSVYNLADNLSNNLSDKSFDKSTELYSVVAMKNEPNSLENIIINATLFNLLNRSMTFENCTVIYGDQTNNISNVLNLLTYQDFVFEQTEPTKLLTGHCYYNIMFDNDIVILDIVFYRNRFSGHEFYGMINNENYDVFIDIIESCYVHFYIWE